MNQAMSDGHQSLHRPLHIVSKANSLDGDKIILILLNCPLPSPELFDVFWQRATLRLCADGGSNRLHELNSTHKTSYIPDFIVGDLDSITDDVKESFVLKGSTVIHTPDQDETDFTKTLRQAVKLSHVQGIEYDTIIAVGSFDGRPDHQLSNYRSLALASTFQGKPCYLFSGDAYATFLDVGKHRIAVDSGLEGSWCSLVPLDGPATSVTTTGLKWNLESQCLGLQQMWSTSNELAGDGTGTVTIDTNNVLLWCAGFAYN